MPFAGYKNFKACVKENSDKKDPEAYCATIMRDVEEGMKSSPVHEVIDVAEAEFSKDETTGKMTARVQLIKAGKAKGKPRRYTSEAIQKAAKEGIYDGLRMFVNHSDKPPTKRSQDELVSAVESTEYDPKADAVVGNVEFFDEKFFDKVQRAKKYMGVSADHRINVTYAQEGQQRIERVNSIEMARSVDWVVYPAAGGEILSFARESEGADDVEWSDVTLEQLKANAPKLLEEYKSEVVKESEPDPKDDDDDAEEGATKNKKAKESETVTMSKDEITRLVQEQVTSIQTAADEKATKISDTGKKTRELVSKSGLPARTQARVINQFADSTEFVKESVETAIEDAKAELKEAGAGPKIKGMGSTGQVQEGEDGESRTITVRESVESVFMKPKKKATTGASGKES